MKNVMDVSKRIESLEAISAIKDLKFKYWKACDTKKPIAVLKCFHADKVKIDFEDFGIFHSAQDMVEKYQINSCHDHLIENHLGKNPVIGLLSNNEANGFWAMSYSLIDTKKKFTLNIQGTYKDLYVRNDSGDWLIKESMFKKTSTFYRSLSPYHCSQPRIARSLGFKNTV